MRHPVRKSQNGHNRFSSQEPIICASNRSIFMSEKVGFAGVFSLLTRESERYAATISCDQYRRVSELDAPDAALAPDGDGNGEFHFARRNFGELRNATLLIAQRAQDRVSHETPAPCGTLVLGIKRLAEQRVEHLENSRQRLCCGSRTKLRELCAAPTVENRDMAPAAVRRRDRILTPAA